MHKLKLYSKLKSYKKAVASILELSHELEYVLIGGSAVEFYTLGQRIRSKDDLDFIGTLDRKNAIIDRFAKLGLNYITPKDDGLASFDLLCFYDGDLEAQVFLINEKYYRAIRLRSKKQDFSIDGAEVKCYVVGFMDLIDMKSVASSDFRFIEKIAGTHNTEANKHEADLLRLFDLLDKKTGSKEKSNKKFLNHLIEFYEENDPVHYLRSKKDTIDKIQ